MLDDGAAPDTMQGGAGNDSYCADNGRDRTVETANAGTDQVFASVSYNLAPNIENMTLTGAAAIDATGNGMNNTLVGNGAGNVLDGLGGLDTLTGGAGSDSFLFDTALASGNVASITDFAMGTDMIMLDRTIFAAIAGTGPLASGAYHTGSGAHDADDRIIYNRKTGDLLYDPDGTGSAAAITFAHIAKGLSIDAASFSVVA